MASTSALPCSAYGPGGVPLMCGAEDAPVGESARFECVGRTPAPASHSFVCRDAGVAGSLVEVRGSDGFAFTIDPNTGEVTAASGCVPGAGESLAALPQSIPGIDFYRCGGCAYGVQDRGGVGFVGETVWRVDCINHAETYLEIRRL